MDLMIGGVGMRRGRPDPETPFTGSTLDFWRVEFYEAARRLRLAAEMKLPGRAWLEFEAKPEARGRYSSACPVRTVWMVWGLLLVSAVSGA